MVFSWSLLEPYWGMWSATLCIASAQQSFARYSFPPSHILGCVPFILRTRKETGGVSEKSIRIFEVLLHWRILTPSRHKKPQKLFFHKCLSCFKQQYHPPRLVSDSLSSPEQLTSIKTNSSLENLPGNLPCEQLLTYCPTASGFCRAAVSQLSSLIWNGPSWSLLLQDLKQPRVLMWIIAPSLNRLSVLPPVEMATVAG